VIVSIIVGGRMVQSHFIIWINCNKQLKIIMPQLNNFNCCVSIYIIPVFLFAIWIIVIRVWKGNKSIFKIVIAYINIIIIIYARWIIPRYAILLDYIMIKMQCHNCCVSIYIIPVFLFAIWIIVIRVWKGNMQWFIFTVH
jgi:hypothetical protein